MSRGLDRYFSEPKQKKERPKSEKRKSPRLAKDDLVVRDLWPILQETVEKMILYPHHLDYTRTEILPQNPSITPEELSIRLQVPLGVALVILNKLNSKQQPEE
jgi:hypothetical protein